MREATPEEFKRDAVEEVLREHSNMPSKRLVPIVKYLAPECEDVTEEYIEKVRREIWPTKSIEKGEDNTSTTVSSILSPEKTLE